MIKKLIKITRSAHAVFSLCPKMKGQPNQLNPGQKIRGGVVGKTITIPISSSNNVNLFLPK